MKRRTPARLGLIGLCLVPGMLLHAPTSTGAAPAPAGSALPALPATWRSTPSALSVDGRPDWRPPVSPVHVARPFTPPGQPWLPGHRGIDLRTRPGAGVRAAGAGRVSFASSLAGRGVVVVTHGALRTTYEPVEAQVLVGQAVRAGQLVGVVATGTGHCGSGRCLHLGLRRGREYLDPMLLLGRTRARLRPW